MKIELERFKNNSHFNILHWEFGCFLVRRGNVSDEDDRDALTLLAAKCLQAVELGHTCVDLLKWHKLPSGTETVLKPDPHRTDEAEPGQPTKEEELTEEDIQLPSPLSPEEWISIMEKYPGIIGESADGKHLPLLFDRKHKLVFLNKYFIAEMEIGKRSA